MSATTYIYHFMVTYWTSKADNEVPITGGILESSCNLSRDCQLVPQNSPFFFSHILCSSNTTWYTENVFLIWYISFIKNSNWVDVFTIYTIATLWIYLSNCILFILSHYIVMHEHTWLLYLKSDKIKITQGFPRIPTSVFLTSEQYTWMTAEESM